MVPAFSFLWRGAVRSRPYGALYPKSRSLGRLVPVTQALCLQARRQHPPSVRTPDRVPVPATLRARHSPKSQRRRRCRRRGRPRCRGPRRRSRSPGTGLMPARFTTRRNFAALPNSEAPQSKCENRACRLAELPACVGLAVGADEREAEAAIAQRPQHRLRAREQGDVGEVFGLHPPHVPRDGGQLPQRHFRPPEDFAGAGMPQRIERPRPRCD